MNSARRSRRQQLAFFAQRSHVRIDLAVKKQSPVFEQHLRSAERGDLVLARPLDQQHPRGECVIARQIKFLRIHKTQQAVAGNHQRLAMRRLLKQAAAAAVHANHPANDVCRCKHGSRLHAAQNMPEVVRIDGGVRSVIHKQWQE